MEFPVYRVISRGKGRRRGQVEVAVLTLRSVDGNAMMASVNRHLSLIGYQWVGRHPDFYDGVDSKNSNAEQMFAGLDAELGGLTKKLERLDEEIGQWDELKKFDEFADETAKECAEQHNLNHGSVVGLLWAIRPYVVEKLKKKQASVKANAVNVGVKAEHAKKYLAEVQKDFPRLVGYTGIPA